MLRFTSAGESHGPGLLGILEGIPAGLKIDAEFVNYELTRRQQGYGRGGRMKIESDKAEILSGVRNKITLGTPIAFLIKNDDFINWQDIMGSGECSRVDEKTVRRPRPGHADLAGAMKYNQQDMRNILERSSARETAVRVAVGAFCKILLAGFGIDVVSQVINIGGVAAAALEVNAGNVDKVWEIIEKSPVRCADSGRAALMMEAIDNARAAGESLGGRFEVAVLGVPPGLGSHVNWEKRLDSRLAAALMGIPAIKAVEVGAGIENSVAPGSEVHDEIYYTEERGIYRRTNHAGGIEGGMSNGETIWVRGYMKPIPTLMKPLSSVDTLNWQVEKAAYERSDVCAVPAAAVVGEAMTAYVLAQAFLEKFGGDSIGEVSNNFAAYRQYLRKVWKWQKM